MATPDEVVAADDEVAGTGMEGQTVAGTDLHQTVQCFELADTSVAAERTGEIGLVPLAGSQHEWVCVLSLLCIVIAHSF